MATQSDVGHAYCGDLRRPDFAFAKDLHKTDLGLNKGLVDAVCGHEGGKGLLSQHSSVTVTGNPLFPVVHGAQNRHPYALKQLELSKCPV